MYMDGIRQGSEHSAREPPRVPPMYAYLCPPSPAFAPGRTARQEKRMDFGHETPAKEEQRYQIAR